MLIEFPESQATRRIKCGNCGALIDTAANTPDNCAPCPKCGGVKRAYDASITGEPTDYLLDNFVAHKLSLLTECSARELSTHANWLNAFILTNAFTVRLDPKQRAYVFNFLRRAEGALSAYHEARKALIEYLETPRNVVSPYFKALLNFENCISQCYQGYELLKTATGEKFFEKDDNSEGERLGLLYNDLKHMDERIKFDRLPAEATAAVWITNHGLESSGTTLSFDELLEMLRNMAGLADQLSMLTPIFNPSLNPDAPTSGDGGL